MGSSRPSARHRPRPVLEGGALRLGDQLVPLRSGAMHYWRLPREHWRDALGELKALGLPMVETYAPWSVHEIAGPEGEGPRFDFGEKDPRKDLGAFLDLAHEQELLAFVRPGPHINAEMTLFGLPERVVNDPDVQARSPRGNPVVLYFPPKMFPIPSHASEAYFEALAGWYEAVGEVLAPRLWPDGPVVLLQIDNEAGYFFRNGPYCQDYHDDAVGLWHGYLAERHGDLAGTGEAHRESYASWAEVRPPVAFDAMEGGQLRPGALARQLDWAGFQEHLLTRAIGKMAASARRAGLDGPATVHNVSLGDGGLPVSIPALGEEVDLVGLDYYHGAREHRMVKRRTLYLAGTQEVPFAPELGVGAPPWFTPLSHEDSLTTALTALAYGLRGFNLYMAVDRDRWYGGAIDVFGHPRPEAADWRRLLAALEESEFHALERQAKVALLWPREYARLARATHLLGALSPSTLAALGASPVSGCRGDALGFEEPIQLAWWDALAQVANALTAANVPYVYVDGDAPIERFAEHAVVFAPSFAFADPARWGKLEELAERGVHVVYGPRLPTLDDTLRERAFPRPGGRAPTPLDPSTTHALVHDWIDRFDLERPYPALPPVDTCLHRGGDRDAVLFVLNPGPRVEAEISLPRPTVARDALSGEPLSGEDTLRVPMAPRSVRMLLLDEVKRPRPKARRRPAKKAGDGADVETKRKKGGAS